MGKGAQRKGADGERELAALLSFGTVPDLIGLSGIHIEVKRVERLNVPAAFRQAQRDSERFRDGAPALFHRRSREPWLVTMELKDWLKLYGKQ